MKRVRIALAHTPRLNVHDGHGGVWVDGDEPEIPSDAADILVSLGLAQFIDNTESPKAAHERAQARQREVAQAAAARSSSIVDDMPPEWRQRVYEEGDQVIEEYLATRPSVSFEAYDASSHDPFTVAVETVLVKRRGRPPGSRNKARPPIEGSDA